jgi:hypothetical protein
MMAVNYACIETSYAPHYFNHVIKHYFYLRGLNLAPKIFITLSAGLKASLVTEA